VLGKPNQFIGQQLQCPASAPSWCAPLVPQVSCYALIQINGLPAIIYYKNRLAK
jgi:hypothetical protein